MHRYLGKALRLVETEAVLQRGDPDGLTTISRCATAPNMDEATG